MENKFHNPFPLRHTALVCNFSLILSCSYANQLEELNSEEMKVLVKKASKNYSFFVTKYNIKADKLCLKLSSIQVCSSTAQKMKFSIKGFFSKSYKIHSSFFM